MRSVRKGDWKLIKYDALDGKVRETQLFNLKDNPHEFLAESHQAKIKTLSGAQPKKEQRNLANDPKYAPKLKEMETLLLSEMKRLDDPHRFWDQRGIKLSTKKASLTLWALLFSLFLRADEPKPNEVFVLFDDIGYGQSPSYRENSPFKTPSLDRLARQGMRFTDAHSAAANCTPTRYGVLTGRYPSRIGQFGVLKTYSKPIIPKTRLTVASFLKSQGYQGPPASASGTSE